MSQSLFRSFLGGLCVAWVFAGAIQAQEDPQPFIERADAALYYPQDHGMVSLTAVLVTRNEGVGGPPQSSRERVSWPESSAPVGSRANSVRMIVPQKIGALRETYDFTVATDEGNPRLTAKMRPGKGAATDADTMIYWLDASGRPVKVEARQRVMTITMEEIVYVDRNGKALVESFVRRSGVDGKAGAEVHVRLEYAQVSGVWLARRITNIMKLGEGMPTTTLIVEATELRVNGEGGPSPEVVAGGTDTVAGPSGGAAAGAGDGTGRSSGGESDGSASGPPAGGHPAADGLAGHAQAWLQEFGPYLDEFEQDPARAPSGSKFMRAVVDLRILVDSARAAGAADGQAFQGAQSLLRVLQPLQERNFKLVTRNPMPPPGGSEWQGYHRDWERQRDEVARSLARMRAGAKSLAADGPALEKRRRESREQEAGARFAAAEEREKAGEYSAALTGYRSLADQFAGTSFEAKARAKVAELEAIPAVRAALAAEAAEAAGKKMLARGGNYQKNGMWEKAIETYREIETAFPDTPVAAEARAKRLECEKALRK